MVAGIVLNGFQKGVSSGDFASAICAIEVSRPSSVA